MKVLVTGGAGFAGSHIVDECVNAGHDVVIIDNISSGSRDLLNPAAKFYELNITDPKVHEIVEAEHIEGIIHQAAQVGVPTSIKDPLLDTTSNVLGTVNLLEAARQFGVKRFVYAASAASYGMPESVPVTEEHPLNPLSFYGLSKKTTEAYIRMYDELFGLDYVMFRYANIYGPRNGLVGEGNVISIFTKAMLHDEPVRIEGDGGATRDYIYIGDVARANRIALESETVKGTFNLSTETEVSVNEVFAILKKITGYDQDAVHVDARVGDIYRSVLSNQKVLAALPWKPETSLEEGLEKMVEWGRVAYGR